MFIAALAREVLLVAPHFINYAPSDSPQPEHCRSAPPTTPRPPIPGSPQQGQLPGAPGAMCQGQCWVEDVMVAVEVLCAPTQSRGAQALTNTASGSRYLSLISVVSVPSSCYFFFHSWLSFINENSLPVILGKASVWCTY